MPPKKQAKIPKETLVEAKIISDDTEQIQVSQTKPPSEMLETTLFIPNTLPKELNKLEDKDLLEDENLSDISIPTSQKSKNSRSESILNLEYMIKEKDYYFENKIDLLNTSLNDKLNYQSSNMDIKIDILNKSLNDKMDNNFNLLENKMDTKFDYIINTLQSLSVKREKEDNSTQVTTILPIATIPIISTVPDNTSNPTNTSNPIIATIPTQSNNIPINPINPIISSIPIIATIPTQSNNISINTINPIIPTITNTELSITDNTCGNLSLSPLLIIPKTTEPFVSLIVDYINIIEYIEKIINNTYILSPVLELLYTSDHLFIDIKSVFHQIVISEDTSYKLAVQTLVRWLFKHVKFKYLKFIITNCCIIIPQLLLRYTNNN